MHARALIALYKNTIQKEIRSKTLIFLLLITIGLIFVVNSGIDLVIKSVEEQNFMNLQGQKSAVFYFLINIWSTFLSIIFGIDCIKSDLETGVASVIMAQPIKRWWYVAMRILGATSIVFGYYVISLLMAGAIFYFTDGSAQLSLKVFGALFTTLLVIFSIISLSAFMSLFMNKLVAFVVSMICTTIISISNTAFVDGDMSYHFKNLGLAKGVGLLAHYLFPRIGIWSSFSGNLISGKMLDINLPIELAHFAFASFALIFAMTWVFKRKEL